MSRRYVGQPLRTIAFGANLLPAAFDYNSTCSTERERLGRRPIQVVSLQLLLRLIHGHGSDGQAIGASGIFNPRCRCVAGGTPRRVSLSSRRGFSDFHFKEEIMLVLGIRFGERIFLGNDTTITLEQIAGGVRLGFAAPPEVRIERECVRNRRLRRITNTIPAATLPPEYKERNLP